MCYVCSCFGWTLDFIQRVLTFILACIMICAICIGLIMAIVAGIAYGYNYSLAEFLTLARTDISVYVRRGQFYDKPDFESIYRRSGDMNDVYTSNASDYQDIKMSDSKPLSNTWLKALGSRKYADKLSKYSQPVNLSDAKYLFRSEDPARRSGTIMEDKLVTEIPKELNPPTPSKPIVMRNYGPIEQITVGSSDKEEDFYIDADRPTFEEKSLTESKIREKKAENKLSLKDLPKSNYVPQARHFGERKYPLSDYPVDDIDENNIVFKPV